MQREEYYRILEKLRNSSNLIIYGVGEAGDNFYSMCNKYGISVQMFVDTYNSTLFKGNKVFNFEEFSEIQQDKIGDVVICNGKYFEDIKKSVLEVMPNSKIYNGGDLYYGYIEFEFDAEPFLLFHSNHQEEIESILKCLDDNYSREVYSHWCEYLSTRDNSVLDGYFYYDQYFPEGLYKPLEGCFVDAGSYNGKNAVDMVKKNPLLEKVVCLEPLTEMREIIENKFKGINALDKLELHTAALSSKNGILRFNIAGTSTKETDDGEIVQSLAIDEMNLEKVSFIKMDIEGAELEALKGASKTIKRDHPYLAICIYHRPEDIVDIPRYIMELGADYKYYIRLHEKNQNELVFYAIP